jgi:hypothetical protein
VAHLEAVHGFPPIKPLEFEGPVPGWNAASITLLKIGRLGLDRTHLDYKIWTDIIPPTERVGKGVLLWYAPPRR